MKSALQAATVVLWAAVCLAAHDTWLVPQRFRVEVGRPVQVALNTSEAFPASEAAAAPDRIASFEAVTASGRAPVSGYRVDGNSLVAEVTPGPGTTIVAAATKPRLIVLKPEDFNGYITAERLEAIVAARKARGDDDNDGRERYSKIAKLALCAPKPAAVAFEKPLGLKVEILPLTDPCELEQGRELAVQVLFDGKPLAGVWLTGGYAGVRGHDYPVWVRTDAEGRARVKLDRKGAWFVRVLHMVPSNEFEDADWQSWFSTFTFEVR
ncbi:MAG TPA: DUF4198 domain-containing protein [Candidatus Xenobia bacterium]|nr:DUF4198 domain-containing protein [Candidatus Xenobia bacterium]